MTFVLDASVAISWLLIDESNVPSERALARLEQEDAAVPTIFWAEVANALWVAERRERLTKDDIAAALAALMLLPVVVARGGSDLEFAAMATEVSRRHAIAVYDSYYLLTALQRRLPLATVDSRLAKAAASDGIELI